MLQGFTQFCIAFLDLLEQPNVLNCDHGLVSKSLEQRDLLVCERTDLLAPNRNDPDGQTFPQQWHGKNSPRARKLLESRRLRELVSLCRQVMNVNRLAVDDRPRSRQAPTDGEQISR